MTCSNSVSKLQAIRTQEKPIGHGDCTVELTDGWGHTDKHNVVTLVPSPEGTTPSWEDWKLAYSAWGPCWMKDLEPFTSAKPWPPPR